MNKVSLKELLDLLKKENINNLYVKIKNEAKEIENKISFPTFSSKSGKYLICLYLCFGKLVHKDTIRDACVEFFKITRTDAQVRHMATQEGLHILNRGDRIPGEDNFCPSGYHTLISLTEISPRFIANKRTGILSIADWEQIKKERDDRCHHCNSKENESNLRDGSITKLHKSHIDPNKDCGIGNMIALCNYCNRTCMDKFIFAPNGSIKGINFKSIPVAKSIISGLLFTYGVEEFSNLIKEEINK